MLGTYPRRSTWKSVKSCSAYGPIFACVDCGASPEVLGTSSGEISVPRIDVSVAPTSSSNWPDETTHRMRCCMSVFGTPAFTP